MIAYWLHVIAVIMLIGLATINYVYLLYHYHHHYMTSDRVLRMTVIIDALVVFPLILLTVATAILIPMAGKNYFSIPWMFTSCVYLSIFVALLTTNIYLKIYYYFRAKMTGIYRLKWPFHLINILQIAILLIVYHSFIQPIHF